MFKRRAALGHEKSRCGVPSSRTRWKPSGGFVQKPRLTQKGGISAERKEDFPNGIFSERNGLQLKNERAVAEMCLEKKLSSQLRLEGGLADAGYEC